MNIDEIQELIKQRLAYGRTKSANIYQNPDLIEELGYSRSTPPGSRTVTAPATENPIVQAAQSQSSEEDKLMPKKMASGGLVDEEDNQLKDYINNQFGPKSATPPVPAMPELAQTHSGTAEENENTMDTDSRIQDSNPGHAPEDLAGYVKGQEAQLDKYGPDQEKAVLDSIMKSHGSLGNRATRGFASLGDAIMGVAGKQGPGFLNSIESRQAAEDKMQADSVPMLQAMNEKQLDSKRALEGMTSATPLGASQTAPLMAFFKRVGVPDSEIPAMLQNPAAARAVVEPFAALMGNQEKLQMESLLKQMELEQRAKQDKASIDLQREKLGTDTEKEQSQSKQDALSQLGKMPWYSRILHGDEKNALQEQAGLRQPDYLKTARDSKGNRIGTRDGKTWESIQ